METAIAILQHEVQRKLGRCMLRLQQYERVLKAVISIMAVEGPPEQLQALRDEKALGVHKLTLGALVGMFTGEYLIPESSASPAGPDNDASKPPSDIAWISVRYSVAMSPEYHAQIKADLRELVDLRNVLVHHFIEHFDIADEDGCRAASTHLDSCYERIDGHCERLKAWVAGMSEMQAQAASFVRSKDFEDALVHGIAPETPVDSHNLQRSSS
jgi:hypothetical protein